MGNSLSAFPLAVRARPEPIRAMYVTYCGRPPAPVSILTGARSSGQSGLALQLLGSFSMTGTGEGSTVERRALVVDDDAAVRVLVSRILAKHGFLVDAVRDGAEAIEKLIEHDYALVTLDLMMPRVDGFAVVKFLTDHQPLTLHKVILMSAFGSRVVEKVPPGVRFIEKPFDIDRLLAEASGPAAR